MEQELPEEEEEAAATLRVVVDAVSLGRPGKWQRFFKTGHPKTLRQGGVQPGEASHCEGFAETGHHIHDTQNPSETLQI